MTDWCEEAFWSYCAQREFRLQICEGCGELRYPPISLCANCLSNQFQWKLTSGHGLLVSGVVFCHAFRQELTSRIPYGIGLVELDEGVRMVTAIVESDLSTLNAGQEVTLIFVPDHKRGFLPCFRIIN